MAACGVAIGTVVDGRGGALRWLLTGSGIAFAATGVFPAVMQHGSPVMQAPSTVGHVVMLLLSSVLWLIAIAVLFRKIRGEPRLRRLLKPFVIVTVVALSGLAANLLHDAIQPLAYRPGLAQRLGFAGTFYGSSRCPSGSRCRCRRITRTSSTSRDWLLRRDSTQRSASAARTPCCFGATIFACPLARVIGVGIGFAGLACQPKLARSVCFLRQG